MKNRSYAHLNQQHRDRIQALLDANHTQKEVARILNISESTVSREVNKRSKKNGMYDAIRAEQKAQVMRSNAKYQGMKIEHNSELKQYIIGQLKQKRSPDEIAGRMRKEQHPLMVGKDAIYKWLYSSYGEKYSLYLCTKRRKKQAKRTTIPNLVSIHRLSVRQRTNASEGDTFVSPHKYGSANVAMVVDKETKFLVARKLNTRKPEEMKQAIIAITSIIKIETLILDRGLENRYHEQFGVPSYFCDSHTPSQKPLIEGSIGLARRWLWKKGTDLSRVSEEELVLGIEYLNTKYRKSLDYMSAREAAEKSGILKSY